jgi:hypothetical protein
VSKNFISAVPAAEAKKVCTFDRLDGERKVGWSLHHRCTGTYSVSWTVDIFTQLTHTGHHFQKEAPHKMPRLNQYDYIFAIGTIFAALDAYNIGANDVAK